MNPANINHKGSGKCAFCKHWYDPTNSAIRPKAPQIGLWEFDPHMKNVCLLHNGSERPAFASCPKYECKL